MPLMLAYPSCRSGCCEQAKGVIICRCCCCCHCCCCWSLGKGVDTEWCCWFGWWSPCGLDLSMVGLLPSCKLSKGIHTTLFQSQTCCRMVSITQRCHTIAVCPVRQKSHQSSRFVKPACIRRALPEQRDCSYCCYRSSCHKVTACAGSCSIKVELQVLLSRDRAVRPDRSTASRRVLEQYTGSADKQTGLVELLPGFDPGYVQYCSTATDLLWPLPVINNMHLVSHSALCGAAGWSTQQQRQVQTPSTTQLEWDLSVWHRWRSWQRMQHQQTSCHTI